MRAIFFVTLSIHLAIAYHDPDLNYHLSQIQKAPNCDHGYSYARPSVQLTTTGVKLAAAAPIAQEIIQAPAYQYSGGQVGYSTGITYQSAAPKITYDALPVATYQASSRASNYATAQGYATKEVHGYATSAGLSSVATNGKTAPVATYAQAPIIAKVTAAPLIAKFSISAPKATQFGQNFIQQSEYSGSSAKASLNSYSTEHTGPVVSQVYVAPSIGYATSPALKIQQVPQYTPGVQYSSVAAPTQTQYHEVAQAAQAAQYSTSSAGQGLIAPPEYFTPVVSQNGVSRQYSAPVATIAQYQTPAVTHYSAPAIIQHSAPVVTQYAAPAISVRQYAKTPISVGRVSNLGAKNVHKEFVENYDAHPRYAFEYSVNDPHSGDIKQQKEERDGEVVKGQYSLVEPDGSVRTVNYVADWETGFHADVHNSKENKH